jgi:hypothetical protein
LFRPVLPFSLQPVAPAAAVCLVLLAAWLVRSPADFAPAGGGAVEMVDIEQVERAVEDLEMLRLFSLEPRAEEEGLRTL